MSTARDEYDYISNDPFVADAAVDERRAFIQKTYLHLAGAVLLFVALCGLFMSIPAIRDPLLNMMFGGQWFLILGGFMLFSWIAQSMAHSGASKGVQYAGLALFAAAEALIFVPILVMVQVQTGSPDIILQSGFMTLLVFGGLTAFVLMSKSDFSFLGPFLTVAGFVALGLIVVSMFAGFNLGILFVSAMIVLMCGYILYDTSNVLHHYHTGQYVAASLALFSSLATLFWYVLQFTSILGDD